MSKKYIIKHIKGELLNFLVKPNKQDIIGMEHDYCKTTECSTLVDHYDECFKRISTVQFENKSDLISNEDSKCFESNVNVKSEANIDNNIIYNNENIEDKSEVILYDDHKNCYRQIFDNNTALNTNDENNINNSDSNTSFADDFHRNQVEQIEIDNACESIITNLNNDSVTNMNNKACIRNNKTQSIIMSNTDDPITNKNLEELSILLRQENTTTDFIPNQVVHYETYQEAVNNNNGKTTKKKCFKYCKYEEGRIRITREEIQTYNKCKKHILLKDFLKLLIWKKFPSINNVCHFNISSVNIAPRTGYTIYAYCKFLSCNNFRIVIRQASFSLVGIVYKSRSEPLHYKNVPLVEQVRGLKKKLLGTRYENRTDPNFDWTGKEDSNENVFARKKRKKKSYCEVEEQVDKQEVQIEHTDEEILYSTEITIS